MAKFGIGSSVRVIDLARGLVFNRIGYVESINGTEFRTYIVRLGTTTQVFAEAQQEAERDRQLTQPTVDIGISNTLPICIQNRNGRLWIVCTQCPQLIVGKNTWQLPNDVERANGIILNKSINHALFEHM